MDNGKKIAIVLAATNAAALIYAEREVLAKAYSIAKTKVTARFSK